MKGFYRFDGRIEAPVIRTREDLLVLLHECGHKACKHTYLGVGKIDLRDVCQEIEAWRYALRCLRPDHHQEMTALALKCIATYNADAEINYGEWLTEKEILAKLGGN